MNRARYVPSMGLSALVSALSGTTLTTSDEGAATDVELGGQDWREPDDYRLERIAGDNADMRYADTRGQHKSRCHKRNARRSR